MNSERDEYIWTDIDLMLLSVSALKDMGYTGHIPEECIQDSPLIKHITRQAYMLNQKGMPFEKELTRLNRCIRHPENKANIEYFQTRISDIERTTNRLKCQVEKYNAKKAVYIRFLGYASDLSDSDCCRAVNIANSS